MSTRPAKFNLVILLVLIGGALLTVFFVAGGKPGSFDIRNRASTTTGQAEITLVTDTSRPHYKGDIFPVKVMLNTGNQAVRRVTLNMFYEFKSVTPTAGNPTPEIQVWNKEASAAATSIISNTNGLEPEFNTSINEVSQDNTTTPFKKVKITFDADSQSAAGYTNNEPELLATIYLKVNNYTTNPLTPGITFQFDPLTSSIFTPTQQDIMKHGSPLSIQLAVDNATTGAPGFTSPAITAKTSAAGTAINNNGSSITNAMTFTWAGIDNPPRPAETDVLLKYAYAFSQTTTVPTRPTATTTTTNPYKIATSLDTATLATPLKNGIQNLYVWAIDESLNYSAAPAKFTVNLNTKPHIDSATTELYGNELRGSAGTTVGKGDVVTLKGYNFGANQGGTVTAPVGKVIMRVLTPTPSTAVISTAGTPTSGATSEIISWSDTEIKFKVPTTVPTTAQTLSIHVVRSDAGTPLESENNISPFVMETKLTVRFKFQGITQDRSKKRVLTVVKGTLATNNTYERTAYRDAVWNASTQSYEVTTVLDGTLVNTASAYSLSIKSDSHLRRRFTNITLSPTKNKEMDRRSVGVDGSPAGQAVLVLAGDVTDDNVLNIADWNSMRGHYSPSGLNTTIAANDLTRKRYDFNGDNFLNVDDASLMLANYDLQDVNGDIQ